MPPTTEFEQLWNGPRLSQDEAAKISGFTGIRPLSRLAAFKKTLDYTIAAPDKGHDYIRPLRMVKDPPEIKLMQQAAAITARGFESSLHSLKPSIFEYQLEAELSRSFIGGGASGHAYSPIVASGASACVLHYISNNHQCRTGELVLIDAGAEYANYAADVTRTWPSDGKFSQRQRAVYQAVLRVQKAAIARLRPGLTLKESELAAAKHMTEELVQLGLLDDVASKDFEKNNKPLFRKYFPHALSHFLGLDTHDVGDYNRPLEPGMVLTVEPGIYIREEGIGIRLEDDILITEDGHQNLTSAIPIEAEDIEDLMA